MAEPTEGESSPRILVPALEGGRNPIYSHGASAPNDIHSVPPDGTLTKVQYIVVRTFLLAKGWVENIFH